MVSGWVADEGVVGGGSDREYPVGGHGRIPAALVKQVMMAATKKGEVCDVGGSAVGSVFEVVDF